MAIFTIWWIIVIGWIVLVMRKSKKNRDNSRSGGPYIQRPNTQKTDVRGVYVSRPNNSANRNFAVMPEQKKVLPNVERDCRVEDNHRVENNIHNRAAQSSAEPNVQRKYAELPKRSNDNRPVAKRLYEGDQVPKGHRMVKCSYCAAENLIPYSSNVKYKCYFCHTDL